MLTKMSKSSRGGGGNTSPKTEKKMQVCGKILRQLADDGHEVATKPGFAEELQAHFNRLPTRYRTPCNLEWRHMHMREWRKQNKILVDNHPLLKA